MFIADAITGIFQGAVKPVLDKWVPDAKDRLEAEQLFFKHAHEINIAQIDVNKEEAKSEKLFVSGWRPFVGWVCAGSMAYAVVGHDLLNWIFAIVQLYTGTTVPVLPSPDTSILLELLFALLGLGGFRTFEKIKGVASK